MEHLRIYIDSSVWNAAFDGHIPEIQSQTGDFFQRVQGRPDVEPFASAVVLQELGRAPADRTAALRDLLNSCS